MQYYIFFILWYGKYNSHIENAFLFAELRQFKLLLKVCERV
jgi:hypothetical protein